VAEPKTTLEVSGDGMRLATEGMDPYAVSPAFDLDGSAVRAVELTMRVDAEVREAQLFWELDAPEGFRGAQSHSFRTEVGDGRYHRYTIRFTDGRRLPAGSRLKRIRIDPTAGPGRAWIRELKIYQGTKLDG
jgi:hypothetical protein